nr:hypothetical protein [Tanacetum cinerariifolium]
MRMEQYLTFTDHDLWEVIVNGDSVSPVASASVGVEGLIPLKTAEQKLAKKNELKAKKFQKLISQLEIHGESISQEDANLKLLRSLPLAWNNIALIMRNKSNLDTLIMDDLYNNLKVTNETGNTAHSVSAASSKDQASTTSYADDVMFSFFSNQSNAPQLDNKDLEQIDTDDLEEIDLKWQVAMLTIRVKRFIKKTGRKLDMNGKEIISLDRTKGNRNRDAPIRNIPVDTSTTNALVVQDGIVPVNASKQSSHRAATSVSAARRVNTAASRPNVNNIFPTTHSYFKAHSPWMLQTYDWEQVLPHKYQEIDGVFVAFRENVKRGKITGKGVSSLVAKKIQLNLLKSSVTTRQLNTVSSPVNAVSSSFTIVDPRRERAQRNEFESMFGQDKDDNGNRMITPVSATGSTYVTLGGLIPVNVATLPNADLPTDPLMPDLEDTTDL